uniref:Uncharacterized protein n=1 Tax=Cucumis melo TaxID=3656 RepID=A0A9I9E6M0_CUCME
ATALGSLLSIEISSDNLPPSIEASRLSGLCLLQQVFVCKAPTAIVASPRTQPPSQSPIRVELVAPSILLRSTLPHQ